MREGTGVSLLREVRIKESEKIGALPWMTALEVARTARSISENDAKTFGRLSDDDEVANTIIDNHITNGSSDLLQLALALNRIASKQAELGELFR